MITYDTHMLQTFGFPIMPYGLNMCSSIQQICNFANNITPKLVNHKKNLYLAAAFVKNLCQMLIN